MTNWPNLSNSVKGAVVGQASAAASASAARSTYKDVPAQEFHGRRGSRNESTMAPDKAAYMAGRFYDWFDRQLDRLRPAPEPERGHGHGHDHPFGMER